MFIVALQTISDSTNGDKYIPDYLKALGERHMACGLKSLHMELGRDSFEQAIEAGGENLSSGEKQIYLEAYDTLVKGMGFDERDSNAS